MQVVSCWYVEKKKLFSVFVFVMSYETPSRKFDKSSQKACFTTVLHSVIFILYYTWWQILYIKRWMRIICNSAKFQIKKKTLVSSVVCKKYSKKHMQTYRGSEGRRRSFRWQQPAYTGDPGSSFAVSVDLLLQTSSFTAYLYKL